MYLFHSTPEQVPTLLGYERALAHYNAVTPYKNNSRAEIRGKRPLGERRYPRSLIAFDPATETVSVSYYGTVIAAYIKSGEIRLSTGQFDTPSTCRFLNDLFRGAPNGIGFFRKRNKIYYSRHGKHYRVSHGLVLNADLSPKDESIVQDEYHLLEKRKLNDLVNQYKEVRSGSSAPSLAMPSLAMPSTATLSTFLTFVEDAIRVVGSGTWSATSEDFDRIATDVLRLPTTLFQRHDTPTRLSAFSGRYDMWALAPSGRELPRRNAVAFFEAINRADLEHATDKDEEKKYRVYYDLCQYFSFSAAPNSTRSKAGADTWKFDWNIDLPCARKFFRELLKYTYCNILFTKTIGEKGTMHHDENLKYMITSNNSAQQPVDMLTPRQNVATLEIFR